MSFSWMWHEAQLNDARPLDIVFCQFMRLRASCEQAWRFDAGNDEVAEAVAFAVVGAHVPAQAGIDQREGDDDALRFAARH